MADEESRLVIRYLQETNDGVASRDDLQAHIATHSSGETTPHEVGIRLHHATLPELADTDIIEYDSRSETIRYQSDPLVEKVLESIEDGTHSPRDE